MTDNVTRIIADLEQQLAASQAREKVLLSAIAKIKAHVTGEAIPNWSGGEATYRSRGYLADVCEVAGQPIDDTALNNMLAEGQAREKVLHGWIEDRCRFDSLNMDLSNWRKFVEEYRAFPTDDTALRAAIQHGIAEFLERTGQYVTNDASRNAALKAERERCANVCDTVPFQARISGSRQCAIAIRALGE